MNTDTIYTPYVPVTTYVPGFARYTPKVDIGWDRAHDCSPGTDVYAEYETALELATPDQLRIIKGGYDFLTETLTIASYVKVKRVLEIAFG